MSREIPETNIQQTPSGSNLLNETNLSMHNTDDINHEGHNATIEQWLITTAEHPARNASERDWKRWCAKDELAAELESMTGATKET